MIAKRDAAKNRDEVASVIEDLNKEFGSKNLRWIAEGLRSSEDFDLKREIQDAIAIINGDGQDTPKERAARRKLSAILGRIK